MIDHRSFAHNLSSCEIKAWGFKPMTSVIPVQSSTNWAIKLTGSWSHCEFEDWEYVKDQIGISLIKCLLSTLTVHLDWDAFCCEFLIMQSWNVRQEEKSKAVETWMYGKCYGIVYLIVYKIYLIAATATECANKAALTYATWQIRSCLYFASFFCQKPRSLIYLWVFLVGLGNWSEFFGCFIEESSEIWRKIKYLLRETKTCLSLQPLCQY